MRLGRHAGGCWKGERPWQNRPVCGQSEEESLRSDLYFLSGRAKGNAPKEHMWAHAGVLPGVIRGLPLRAHAGRNHLDRRSESHLRAPARGGLRRAHLCRPPLQTAFAQLRPPRPRDRTDRTAVSPMPASPQPNPEGSETSFPA